jgi:hypothetical protein
VHGTINVLVDDDVVEGALMLGLLVGDAEAVGDFASHFGLAGDEAAVQFVGWAVDEDQDSVGAALFDDEAAVDLELEDYALATREKAIDLALEGAVAIAGKLDVLFELADADTTVELVGAKEEVLAAIRLAGAHGAGCGAPGDAG